MSPGKAIYKLTGELAEWFKLDAGVLAEGRRADIVVLDPKALDERVDKDFEAPMEGIEDYVRVVRRNPGVIKKVIVNGKTAVENDELVAAVGKTSGFGQVLRAVH